MQTLVVFAPHLQSGSVLKTRDSNTKAAAALRVKAKTSLSNVCPSALDASQTVNSRWKPACGKILAELYAECRAAANGQTEQHDDAPRRYVVMMPKQSE